MDGTSFNMSTAPVEALRASAIAKPQRAFAIAFAVLATALAGCASGLGATAADHASLASVARVEEGTVVGASAAAKTSHGYMIRLRSGELVSVRQEGAHAITTGTPVVIQFGGETRVIPQNASIGYL